jgi:predicted acylesterase/phospholipase RssA
LLGGLLLAGCANAPRLDTPPASPVDAEPPGFNRTIRTDTLDFDFYKENAARSTATVVAVSDGSIDILALSGGGAGGAFGAGVLVGLTNARTRPQFEVVTGVSTGALIAPFAFLGPDWDGKLTEAYRGEATDGLLQSRGIGVLFDPSVFQGEPLRALVNRFVTDELIDAVAKEAATGRMLLAATTNLDREETTIWNLGAIAQQDGDKARNLFRDVLVASSSVPGVFPPVMIDVEKDGKRYQAMHVDGGASTPFFVAPDAAMMFGEAPPGLRGANIYVIVNGQASSSPRTTLNNTMDVAARSFSAVLNHMTRTALAQADAFAQRGGMNFRFTTIPSDVQFGGSLAFDQANMRETFDYGMRCATRSLAWVTPKEAMEHMQAAGSTVTPAATADCPLLAIP